MIPNDETLDGRLRENEREYIREALEKSLGNVALASRLLCVCSPQNLWARIRRLCINVNHFRPVNEKWGALSVSKMDTIYQPTNPACPTCEKIKGDGFPELQKSTGIRWYCWYCESYFVRSSDGKFRKIIEGSSETKGENPGQHVGKKVTGSPGPPKGTPAKPRIVP